MSNFSITEFSELSEADQRKETYRLSLETNSMVKKHEPVINRILQYENLGLNTGKWFMRIFIVAFGTGISLWLAHHFGVK